MNQLPLATNFTTVNYEVKSALLDAAYNAMPPEQQAHIDQQVVTLTAEIKRLRPSQAIRAPQCAKTVQTVRGV